MNTHVWVLIPAHRPALGHVRENLELLGPDLVERTVVIANGQHPITEHELDVPYLLHDHGDINISRWWNLGLDWIEEMETEHDRFTNPHQVLVLNADTRIKPEGVARLSWALDQDPKVVMAGPAPGLHIRKETRPGPLGLDKRVPGWCFMLTSQNPIRADEQFRWWCGDDDLEWRARAHGGTLRVGRIEAAHLGDGQPRGELARLAQQDLIRFEVKWQTRPW